MSHTRLWAAAAIIASAVAAGFIFSVPRTGDVVPAEEQEATNSSTPPVVSLRDSFKKGVHTITGSVEAPDACTTTSAQALLEGDTPETARIVVVVSLAGSDGVCLEVPTLASFTATIATPADIPLSATVNGVAATTTGS